MKNANLLKLNELPFILPLYFCLCISGLEWMTISDNVSSQSPLPQNKCRSPSVTICTLIFCSLSLSLSLSLSGCAGLLLRSRCSLSDSRLRHQTNANHFPSLYYTSSAKWYIWTVYNLDNTLNRIFNLDLEAKLITSLVAAFKRRHRFTQWLLYVTKQESRLHRHSSCRFCIFSQSAKYESNLHESNWNISIFRG